MADFDTANKRAAMLSLGMAFPVMVMIPDSNDADSVPQREGILRIFPSIPTDNPAVGQTTGQVRTKRRVGRERTYVSRG